MDQNLLSERTYDETVNYISYNDQVILKKNLKARYFEIMSKKKISYRLLNISQRLNEDTRSFRARVEKLLKLFNTETAFSAFIDVLNMDSTHSIVKN